MSEDQAALVTRSTRKGEHRRVIEILDFEGVLAEAGGVGGVGEEGIVVADFEDAEAEEGVAFGECD